MSDNDKKTTSPGDVQTEDNITFHTGVTEEKSARNIKPAPVVHTSGSGEIRIPDSVSDEFASDTVISRFIKTNATPFVSVSDVKEPENDARDIDRYSDRLSVKAPEKKPFTGYTAKLNVYSSIHASDAGDGRMILREEPPVQTEDAPETAEAVPDRKSTKEMSFDNEGKPAIEDVYESAPTKQIKDPKGALLREIAGTAEDGVRRNPDQLMMEGFDSVGKKNREEKVREEAELQNELHKSRQQRISSFHFWDKKFDDADASTADKKFSEAAEKKRELPAFLQKISNAFAHLDTSFTPVKSEEYTDFNKRKEVFGRLIAARKGVLTRLLAVSLIGIVLFAVDIAASVSAASNANGFFTVLGGNYTLYVTINLAALAAVAAMLFRDLKTGFFSLLKIHPKTNTSLLLLMLAALAQTVCAYFTQLKLEENFHLLAPAAVLLCVPYLLSKLFYYDSTRHCFKAAASKSEKSYLRRVSDENLVAGLLKNRESAGQNVVYAGKTRFIDRFLARSADSAFSGMPSSRCVLITAAAALLTGVVSAVLMKDAVYGITAATLTLALSFPVSCLAETGFCIAAENKKLSVKSSFVQSHTDARDFAAIDNIVVNDTDIFSARITNCLTARGVSEKQAKFCAAVLTAKFGGPLNNALKDAVSAFEDRFPTAENLVYEEKLGLSAWVSGCKVLLGTHTLLVNHNVQLPDEKTVMAFLAEGDTPVYMALEGRFAAVFGVEYSCVKENAESLKELVNNGASILLSTVDANLSEARAEELLGLPECSVSTFGAAAAEKLGASMQAVTDSEEAGIVFTDSFDSLCRCALSAIKLERSKRTAKLVCEAGAYVGVVLAAVLSFTGSFSEISSVPPVLVQILWLILCFAAPLLFTPSAVLKKGAVPAVGEGLSKLSAGIKAGSKAKKDAPEDDASEMETSEADEAEKAAENTPKEAVQAIIIKEEPKKRKKAAAQKAEIKEESEPEPEEKAEEPIADEPGVLSESTYAALDALAGIETKKTAAPEQPEETGEASEPETEAPDEPEDEPDRLAETLGRAKKLAGRFLSRFTVEEESAEDEPEATEAVEETASADSKNEKKRPFTATIPVKKRRRDENMSPSEEYSRQLSEEEHTRVSFTPPEFPEAPHYDLSKPKINYEKNPLDEKFVPPEPTQSSFYDDAAFARFEDDNIFAALRESGNKKIDL